MSGPPVRWGSVEAARLTPPGIADGRGRDLVAAVAALIRERPLDAFLFVDWATVDARFLPALIATAGLSDLIEPGLPEDRIRALGAEAREINLERGFVSGIKRGLELVGMRPTIVQWFQTEPKGPPNTHRITVHLGEQVFGDGTGPIITAPAIRQARRIIDGMKRWSQDTHFSIGVAHSAGLGVAGGARATVKVPLARGVNHSLGMAGVAVATCLVRFRGVAA